jgi:hypothetical protein
MSSRRTSTRASILRTLMAAITMLLGATASSIIVAPSTLASPLTQLQPLSEAPGRIHILADTDIGGGWRMSNNQSVSSPGGRTQLKLLRGLLEVWRDGSHGWTAGQSAGGDYVDFQHDGNLVVYTNAGRAVWASNTSFWCGPDGCHLSIQDSGNVAIEDDVTNYDVWSTNIARP